MYTLTNASKPYCPLCLICLRHLSIQIHNTHTVWKQSSHSHNVSPFIQVISLMERLYTHTHRGTHTHTHTYIHRKTHTYITHTQRHTHTQRKREREAHTHTNKKKHRE